MADTTTDLDAAVEAGPEVKAAEAVEANSMSALIAKRAEAKARAAAPVKPAEPTPVVAPVVEVAAPPAEPAVPPAKPVADVPPPVVEPAPVTPATAPIAPAPEPMAPVVMAPEPEPIVKPAPVVPPAEPAPVTPPPAPKLTPWTATGRTRQTGATFDFATGRAVRKTEVEYSRPRADGSAEAAWTSTGAPPA